MIFIIISAILLSFSATYSMEEKSFPSRRQIFPANYTQFSLGLSGNEHINCLSWSTKKDQIAAGISNGNIIAIDSKTGSRTLTVRKNISARQGFIPVLLKWNHDDRRIAVGEKAIDSEVFRMLIIDIENSSITQRVPLNQPLFCVKWNKNDQELILFYDHKNSDHKNFDPENPQTYSIDKKQLSPYLYQEVVYYKIISDQNSPDQESPQIRILNLTQKKENDKENDTDKTITSKISTTMTINPHNSSKPKGTISHIAPVKNWYSMIMVGATTENNYGEMKTTISTWNAEIFRGSDRLESYLEFPSCSPVIFDLDSSKKRLACSYENKIVIIPWNPKK